jgi:lipid-binding SYLF domain-containing protein
MLLAMNLRIWTFLASLSLLSLTCACSTAPSSDAEKIDLHRQVIDTFEDFKQKDPTLASFISTSYGYVMFPSITKGAAVVGGAHGNGEVYDHGNRIGYADISQYTFGLALGGESYAELILFQDKAALDRFEQGKFTFAANVSAVAVNAGVGASLKYADGVAAVVKTNGGFMGEADIGGQNFKFTPL